MTQAVQTAVVGVTGFAGAELARLLVRHPRLKGKTPVFAGRVEERDQARGGIPLQEIHPQLIDSHGTGSLRVQPFSWELLEDLGVEVVFLATPHELSREAVPEARKRGLRVIDLSGAWRLEEAANRAVYGFEDEGSSRALNTQAEAVYGMPELHRDTIRGAGLVANPGCYATSVIVPLAPLVKAGLVDRKRGVICDAKSGVSGAGKKPTEKTHFVEVADNFSAYSVFGHRHTGEILEQAGLDDDELTFTPHLLPIPRGILSTIYVSLARPAAAAEIEAVLREAYPDGGFVRVYGNKHLPQVSYSLHTNFCDVGFELARDGRRLTIVSCLDNLMKGAAGQALQNMNVMLGWSEKEGLA